MESIRNLALLKGGDFDSCKRSIISTTIDEFKDKKLKMRNNKVVKNKKQAIAIALSQVDDKCKYNPTDTKKLIQKVSDDLNDKNKKLNLSNIVETKNAIELLISKKKPQRVYIFKKLLWNKIIDSQIHNETLDKNMWNEIKTIHDL